MSLAPNQLELLSPAKTAEIGREAVLHGADAIYIGGPSFGARANAENSVQDIAGLVSFAHRFGTRIFVTLNTILHDNELEPARKLIHQFYDAGVDALIVQDMGILELDIPPIQLHASTQCDIRTTAKGKFLAQSGFSQIVLARELTLQQIAAMRAEVPAETTLEFFIHGALCVAFSGQCYISHAHTERSANRGDCTQACRLPYTLEDAQGRVVAYDKHLLSMKDNDQTANMRLLVDAGIRSFKIEGRYKDMGYVKNVTAHYRQILDGILDESPELASGSAGRSSFTFQPEPEKTYNRSTTDYFVSGRKTDIGAFDAPTHVGQAIGTVTRIGADWFEMESDAQLANGDGLTWMHKRELQGMQANTAQLQGTKSSSNLWRIVPNQKISELTGLVVGTPISRNRDHAWEQALTKKSADRRISVDMRLEETPEGFALILADESGVCATASIQHAKEAAQDTERAAAGLRDGLAKLGNTIFVAGDITLAWSQAWFLPASVVNALRRDAIEKLEAARAASWQRPLPAVPVEPPVAYPEASLSYLANVYNVAARAFYSRHGVKLIAAAYEAHEETGEVPVMITKHCLRFSFNLCPKQAKGVQGVQGQVRAEPMTLINGTERITLKFDCKPCEMHVMGTMTKSILRTLPPSSMPASAPIIFHARRPA
ncbi:MAG TPA: U32 family peptidase [Rhodocyclaceae bacterium]|nr:U32 family peptidase [Rhodocyclaceae bacterium]